MIINNEQSVKEYLQYIKNQKVIVIPIMGGDGNKIPSILNYISSIYIYSIDEEIGFLFPVNHYESLVKSENIKKILKKHFVVNRKSFIFAKRIAMAFDFIPQFLLDLKMNIMFFSSIDNKNFELDTKSFHKFDDLNNNYFVPLHKHLSYANNIALYYISKLTYENNSKYETYEYMLFKVFCEIENSGIQVIRDKLFSYFKNIEGTNIYKNKIYSKFNLYNPTSRPTNSFAGINFMGLKKKTGERQCFISRWNNGYLVQFDFESYHPRLLYQILDSELSKNINFYQMIGGLVKNKSYEDITKEEIEEFKKKTFFYLYGDSVKYTAKINFFKKLQNFKNYLYKFYKENGYITSYFFKRKIFINSYEKITKGKVLNYFIQSFETENNLIKIYRILEYMNKKNISSKIILYQYDSILIDFNFNDGIDFLKKIKYILEEGNYKIKTTVGKNFNEMLSINKKKEI